jgi:hypothetical protein
MRVLVTGGAGFLRVNSASILQPHHNCTITAFENLQPRGSELVLQASGRRSAYTVEGMPDEVMNWVCDYRSELKSILNSSPEGFS